MTETPQQTEDYIEAAKRSGAALLAHFPQYQGWHLVVWKTPTNCLPHWCIEGHWTPGPDPDAFLPMPPEPKSA